MVYHRAGRGVAGDVADREAVLDDVVAGLEVMQDNLVAPGDVHGEGNALHGLALGEVLQRYGDVVGGVDFDVLHRFLDCARNDN